MSGKAQTWCNFYRVWFHETKQGKNFALCFALFDVFTAWRFRIADSSKFGACRYHRVVYLVWLLSLNPTDDSFPSPVASITISSSGSGSVAMKRSGNFHSPPVAPFTRRCTSCLQVRETSRASNDHSCHNRCVLTRCFCHKWNLGLAKVKSSVLIIRSIAVSQLLEELNASITSNVKGTPTDIRCW